jgi:dTDP-4-dehydrorhamnose reductase
MRGFLVNQQILITGATGLLGQALMRRLSQKNEILGVTRSKKHKVLSCDLRDPGAVAGLFSNYSFNLVIHSAAFSDVDGCERDPENAYRSNVLATRFLAQHCREKNIPLLYISTDYVFNGLKKRDYEIDDTPSPINIYGMTKLGGEVEVKRHTVLSAIVRTSWLFGPGHPNNFLNQFLNRVKTEKVARILDDQKDSPTYVNDLAVAIEKIAIHLMNLRRKNPSAVSQALFQVCNKGQTTRYGMAVKVKELLGLKRLKIEKLKPKDIKGRLALRPQRSVMSTRAYEKFFGCRLRPWEKSLEEYLRCGC